MEEEGKSILDDYAKVIPQNIEVKSVFEVGSPGPAVLSVAKKYNADLIVMGKPRLRALERSVHGICQQLRRHAFRLPRIDCQIKGKLGGYRSCLHSVIS